MYGHWHSTDRMLICLAFASIVHAVIILGVVFDMPKHPKPSQSLEITLIPAATDTAPEKADFLAPENQIGGGVSDKKVAPRSEPKPQITGRGRELTPAPDVAKEPDVKPKPVLKQARSEKSVADDVGVENHSEEPRPVLSADVLSQQVAEISAELNRTQQEQTKRTRFAYVNSVNAHKYNAAAFESAWRDKVERIGNLNYPEDARRLNLSGSLLLAVGIKPDGSLYSIDVRRSSGSPILDDAAIRIVKLAAPFASFPEELRKEVDVLVITRTWKFSNDSRLETGP